MKGFCALVLRRWFLERDASCGTPCVVLPTCSGGSAAYRNDFLGFGRVWKWMSMNVYWKEVCRWWCVAALCFAASVVQVSATTGIGDTMWSRRAAADGTKQTADSLDGQPVMAAWPCYINTSTLPLVYHHHHHHIWRFLDNYACT